MLKRDLNIYLEGNGGHYKMPIYPDVSYSQVFKEESLPQKTLHNPERVISNGFTSDTNPGNFNFTIPLMNSDNMVYLLKLMFSSPEKRDIIIENKGNRKCLKNSVFESFTFNTIRDSIITLSCAGTFTSIENYNGNIVSLMTFGDLYTFIEGIQVSIDGEILEHIHNFNIEVKNSINWLPSKTMHDSGPSTRKNFVFSEQVVSGNIINYSELEIPEHFDHVPIEIQIKCGDSIFLNFTLSDCIVSTRQQLDEIIKTGIDYRLTGNSNNNIKYKGVNIYES